MELACREMKIIHDGMRRMGRILLNSKRRYCNERPAVILGIETSCDDTGCAVVDSDGNVLGEALHSQQQMHLKYNVDRWICLFVCGLSPCMVTKLTVQITIYISFRVWHARTQ